jgi:hypothetical protein
MSGNGERLMHCLLQSRFSSEMDPGIAEDALKRIYRRKLFTAVCAAAVCIAIAAAAVFRSEETPLPETGTVPVSSPYEPIPPKGPDTEAGEDDGDLFPETENSWLLERTLPEKKKPLPEEMKRPRHENMRSGLKRHVDRKIAELAEEHGVSSGLMRELLMESLITLRDDPDNEDVLHSPAGAWVRHTAEFHGISVKEACSRLILVLKYTEDTD